MPAPSTETRIEDALAAMLGAVEPDPLFVRRLRSESVNRFVAVREGTDHAFAAHAERSVMGSLGRVCLYASFVLGVTATSVLAASQEALPGDALYALKMRIEHVRLEVLPGHLHDDLYAYALGERIAELGRLIEAGQADQALAMMPVVEQAYRHYTAAALPGDDGKGQGGSQHHLLVLQGLTERLPDGARSAIQGMIDRGSGHGGADPASGSDASEAQGNPNVGGGGEQGGPSQDPPGRPEATPRPERTAEPEDSPPPELTAEPKPTREPRPSPADSNGLRNGPSEDAAD